MFRSKNNKVPLKKIESVYTRLNSCGKSVMNDTELINMAISNNPNIGQLKSKIDNYKQRITENSLILKKEKNKETKKVLNKLINDDKNILTHLDIYITIYKNIISLLISHSDFNQKNNIEQYIQEVYEDLKLIENTDTLIIVTNDYTQESVNKIFSASRSFILWLLYSSDLSNS